jgi:hypothetical protein
LGVCNVDLGLVRGDFTGRDAGGDIDKVLGVAVYVQLRRLFDLGPGVATYCSRLAENLSPNISGDRPLLPLNQLLCGLVTIKVWIAPRMAICRTPPSTRARLGFNPPGWLCAKWS